MRWKEFEKNCLKFLIRNTASELDFIESGKSNSRETDIKVYKKSKYLFSIEAKLLPSQSGLFVVEFTDSTFSLSKKNFSINSHSKKILDYLNLSNLPYSGGTVDLSLTKELINDWIMEHYNKKGVKFFIVSNDPVKDFKIIPVSELIKFIGFKATLRRKKSGSRDLPISLRKSALQEISNYLSTKLISILKTDFFQKKTIITLSKELEIIKFNSYYFSKINDTTYRLKLLSSTNNPTVIFSMNYIKIPTSNGLELIQQNLKL